MTHFKQSRESRVSPLRQLSLCSALFHPENAYEYVRFFSMSPTHFHQLGTLKETRRNLHSKTLHFNLEENYVVRQTSSSKHLTFSSSQINGKQKQISLHHAFIYFEKNLQKKKNYQIFTLFNKSIKFTEVSGKIQWSRGLIMPCSIMASLSSSPSPAILPRA
jgi:hypothetical protein